MTRVRMSIVFFYMRLFNKDGGLRIDCYVLLVASIVWSVGEMYLDWLICQPATSDWGSSIKGCYCGKISAAFIAVHESKLMETSGSQGCQYMSAGVYKA